jgi:hypothetical protein
VSIGVALCGSLTGTALAHLGSDFATAARPLWFVCVGLGIVVFCLGFYATTPKALRSAERLAPLIERPLGPKVAADV